MKRLGQVLRPAGLTDATFEQIWRVIKAERLGIGPWCTRLAVWGEIREAKGWKDGGPMAEVTPKELLDLYTQIEEAESPSERYAILAKPIPEKAQRIADKPLVWFDIIHGLTAPHIIQSVGRAAYELANSAGRPWERALDVGTGTGNLAAVLLGRNGVPRSVGNLTTVDRELPMLAIASARYPEANHVAGDVLALPFPDASFDLITSGGLAYSLGYEEQTRFFGEVGRLLRPSGVYLDGDYRNSYLHPDNTYVGPKHGLESFIVSHVAPAETAPVQLGPDDFAHHGLHYSTLEYAGARPNEITDVRVLQKIG